MKNMVDFVLLLFVSVILVKVFLSFINVYRSSRYFKKVKSEFDQKIIFKEPSILIIIPVLFEQKIILKTLDHFCEFEYSNYKIIVAGSQKEINQSLSNEQTTSELVCSYVKKKKLKGKILTYIHCDEKGKRSSQINGCLSFYMDNYEVPDILGIYDADSIPDKKTLKHVAIMFSRGYRCVQQPLHYRQSGKNSKSGYTSANAIYQGAWNLIKEIPNILNYELNRKNSALFGNYYRSLYLNGHGQFLDVSLYKEINGVPEDVVTDGIQLGYRLSLIGERIGTIPSFCSDDVPISLKDTIYQHKRWFAGNIQYGKAFSWAKSHNGKNISKLSFSENILLNLIWAFRMPLIVFLIAYFSFNVEKYLIEIYMLITSIALYTLVIPVITHKIQNNKFIELNFRTWILLPFAAGVKSIGPILYIVDYILYGKRAINKLKKAQR